MVSVFRCVVAVYTGRVMRIRSCLLSLFLLAGISVAAAAQVRLETAGPPKDASAEIAQALPAQGERVVLANGNPLCEIWLAGSLPGAPGKDKDTEHTNYSGALAPGEFLGVISFPNGAKDFRGQAIKAGAYTLRYMIMPNDGAHMGAAPERDFLLLAPPASDASRATMTTAKLLQASTTVSGTSHPAVFMLIAVREAGKAVEKTPSTSSGQAVPPPAGGDKGGGTASVYESPEGYVVFAGKAGSVPVALVVKGQAEQ